MKLEKRTGDKEPNKKKSGRKRRPHITGVAFFAPLQFLLKINIHLKTLFCFAPPFPRQVHFHCWLKLAHPSALRVAHFSHSFVHLSYPLCAVSISSVVPSAPPECSSVLYVLFAKTL